MLELAPAFKAIHTSPSTFIWSVVSAGDGSIFIGTGSPARVYRISPDGNATVIFEPKELQVQALAIDKEGSVYAATSPDGKVYKIAKGKGPSKASSKASPDVKTDANSKDQKDAASNPVAVDP